MGAFTDIFGKVPRVAILEILAENSDEELTVKDIIDETEVSKREAYSIIRDFIKIGLVLESGKRPKRYGLNKNDVRAQTLIKAEPLLIMGKLEFELKLDDKLLHFQKKQESTTPP
jgi:sugar-specific transcriptional regulator TrmB